MDSNALTSNENLDPISGEPGAHPVGTGVGAVIGGLVAGAATGTVAGPVGTVIGAAIGAALGGLAGKGVAESIDPTQEAAYWREHYRGRPYIEPEADFDNYAPAYNYGVLAFGRHRRQRFDDIETQLAHDWIAMRGESDLEWQQARHAAKDAWDRLSELSESGAGERRDFSASIRPSRP